MKRKDLVISLRNINKVYTLPTKKGGQITAIKNVTINVKRGEKLGIIGDNGAGKTTLIKLIAGITLPTSGKISVKGKVVSLINLEAGFNQELTGRENIVLNGMIYGLSRKEILTLEEKIIDFADIGDFIDSPFYIYSSGMKFRLALSVALVTNPEIILMDEVFMSGDIDFQIKTLKKIEEITKDKKVTLIMTSHYPLILRKYCQRFILLKNGMLVNSSIRAILDLTKKWNEYFSSVKKMNIEKDLSVSPFYQR